ncbi:hypothetical protein PAXRUDRAFT_833633 [Paxillus rubicundulus Ve08.2h10]|uniref:Unplaced genomic scaffold scaffold_1236, whole genome shotgun sequence n=1 Tax=Paxillus rubicundulus Ve08.2h10 TaxID=930991 RepID=A0A0D0CBQ4_9AGAM|nr:hypothetical protein PAXRUDRAFT_833633 [Paxillus rubicundulus Ve08.2h10]
MIQAISGQIIVEPEEHLSGWSGASWETQNAVQTAEEGTAVKQLKCCTNAKLSLCSRIKIR